MLDGELVVCRDGRLDFVALQRRLHARNRKHAATTAYLVVFDVLALGGDDVRRLSYVDRRSLVVDLLAGVTTPLAVMPMTTSEPGAKAWLTEHLAAGIEGVVAKHLMHAYRPAWRTWQKVRTRVTAEAVVGGVIGPMDAPEVLILGRVDADGWLRVAGRTGPLPVPVRAELGAVLQPPRRIHPWPVTIPSSRFGQLPPKPVEYTPADPAVVVELDADVAFECGRRSKSRDVEPRAKCRTRRDVIVYWVDAP